QGDHEEKEDNGLPKLRQAGPAAGEHRESSETQDERQPFKWEKTRRRTGEPDQDREPDQSEARDRPRARIRDSRDRRTPREQVEGKEGNKDAVRIFGLVGPGVIKLAEGRPVDPAENRKNNDDPGGTACEQTHRGPSRDARSPSASRAANWVRSGAM